jgi:hypothetical protein
VCLCIVVCSVAHTCACCNVPCVVFHCMRTFTADVHISTHGLLMIDPSNRTSTHPRTRPTATTIAPLCSRARPPPPPPYSGPAVYFGTLEHCPWLATDFDLSSCRLDRGAEAHCVVLTANGSVVATGNTTRGAIFALCVNRVSRLKRALHGVFSRRAHMMCPDVFESARARARF